MGGLYESRSNGIEFARKLGPGDDSAGIKKLRSVSADELLKASVDDGFDAVVDGWVLPDPYMRMRRDWKASDSFRLMFQFQSGRVIEIESETVELVPVMRASRVPDK